MQLHRQAVAIDGSHLGIAFAKPFCQIGCDDCLILHRFYAVGDHRHSRHHFSDTALDTPSSCTSVHLLSGLYSFIAAAIREVFSPRLR